MKALLGNIEEKNESDRKKVIEQLSNSAALLPINNIQKNPFQPRKDFDEKELQELAISIKTYGLIQPITVRSMGDGSYQIISGERRLRASKLAKLEEIPCYIRIADDQTLMEMALVENIQRTDLNSLEIAFAYQRLLEEFSLTHETVASRVGKNRSTVTNYLRLLKLPPSIQQALKNEDISMGHAKILAGVENIDLQLKLFNDTIDNHFSVRVLEDIAGNRDKQNRTSSRQTSENEINPLVKDVEKKMISFFETKVAINRNKKGKGNIKIFFNTDDDLNDILDKLDI